MEVELTVRCVYCTSCNKSFTDSYIFEDSYDQDGEPMYAEMRG